MNIRCAARFSNYLKKTLSSVVSFSRNSTALKVTITAENLCSSSKTAFNNVKTLTDNCLWIFIPRGWVKKPLQITYNGLKWVVTFQKPGQIRELKDSRGRGDGGESKKSGKLVLSQLLSVRLFYLLGGESQFSGIFRGQKFRLFSVFRCQKCAGKSQWIRFVWEVVTVCNTVQLIMAFNYHNYIKLKMTTTT